MDLDSLYKLNDVLNMRSDYEFARDAFREHKYDMDKRKYTK